MAKNRNYNCKDVELLTASKTIAESYGANYIQANTLQKNLKGSTRTITNDVIDTFNTIYNEIIGICKIASAYYRFESVKKEQFSFMKTVAKMGADRKAPAEIVAPTE